MPSKKQHPADMASREDCRGGLFYLHLRSGPHEKITKEAKTLIETIAIRDEMGTTPSGKKAMLALSGAQAACA